MATIMLWGSGHVLAGGIPGYHAVAMGFNGVATVCPCATACFNSSYNIFME